MSSKAWSTVLFPEPESPVRITSCRAAWLAFGFTGGAGSILFPALVSAGDTHVLAVLRYGAAGDVNARIIEFLGDLFVGQWLRRIFFFNHLLDEPLESEQRHAAALGPVDRFTEEGTQLQHALRRMRVLAGHGAAYGRGVHADLFGHFLDHHGLEGILAVIEEFALARDDGLADTQNGVLALLDVFHQLDGGGEAFFHVVSNVAVGGVLHEQAPVGRAQPQLRHVVFIQERLPLVIHLPEVHIRLDKTRLRFVVTQARTRIEFLDRVQRVFHHLERPVQGARYFFHLVGLDLFQVLRDDLLRQRILWVE